MTKTQKHTQLQPALQHPPDLKAQPRPGIGSFPTSGQHTSTGSVNLTTPGDDATPAPKPTPAKGKRYAVLGKGEGDYCIYQIVAQGSGIPAGSLVVIPEVPRFRSTQEAKRWVKNDSGDLLSGKQVMILRAMAIMTINVQNRPVVDIQEKPLILVTDPTSVAEETENA